MIKFKDSLGGKLKDKEKLHKDLDSVVVAEYTHIPTMQHIKLKEGLAVKEAIKLYKEDPDIEFVQPNYIYELHATSPTETLQWNMYKVQMPLAWDYTQGSKNYSVALIDTGIHSSHWDLVSNILTDANGNTGFDATVGQTGDYRNLTDDGGHGTHVAGIMGAVANNGGVVGVNWVTDIYTCKAPGLNDGEITNCINNIINRKTTLGHNIVAVNASWGTLGRANDRLTYGALRANVKALQNAGILLVASASNYGLPRQPTDMQNCSLTFKQDHPDIDVRPVYPASLDLPNVIAVTQQAGTSRTFTAVYRDYNGASDIRGVYIMIRTDATALSDALIGYYDK